MIQLGEIDLYLTNRCNLNCPFCSIEANTNCESELSLDQIYDFINSASILGLEELHLTGGEPLMRKDICDVVRCAVNSKLNVRLITNGTLLTPELFNSLYRAGLKSIMFSLDGTENYHNAIRGLGSYEKTLNAISRSFEKKDMTVRVNSVAWMNNMKDIKSLILLMERLGINTYSIFLGSPLGYGMNYFDQVIPPSSWYSFTKELKHIVNSNCVQMKVVIEKGFLFEDEIGFNINSLSGRGVGCYSMSKNKDYFLVRANGDIYPCVFFSNSKHSLGNIRNESLKTILKRYSKNPFYLKMGEFPSDCLDCNHIAFCRGGCRGYSKIYSGDWSSKDPRCQNAKSKFIPVCPIMKLNLNTGKMGGSSEEALKL